jgi:hypothetical protein
MAIGRTVFVLFPAVVSTTITELEAVVDDLREIVALVEKEEGVEK